MAKTTKNQQSSAIKWWQVAPQWGFVIGVISLVIMLGGDDILRSWLIGTITPDSAKFLPVSVVSAIITVVFGFIMGWLLDIDLKNHTYNKSWYPTIGMLGTFVGIFIGLWTFKVDVPISEITNSLSTLLNGLKLAFITSIVGVALSCIRKFYDFTGINKIGTDAQEESVYESIVASADNTGKISAQITSLNDNISKLTKKLVNNVSDEFVAALGNVAKDLNDKLSTQFGENFRAFAGAVDKLVEWQETNKKHMDSYIEQLEKYAETYNKKLDLLTNAANGLDKTVEAAQEKIGEINTGLTTLSNLNTSATSAIEKVDTLITKTDNALSEMNKIPDTVTSGINGIIGVFQNNVKGVKRDIRSAGNHLCNAMEQSAMAVYTELHKYSATHEDIKELLQKVATEQNARVAQANQATAKAKKASRTKKED